MVSPIVRQSWTILGVLMNMFGQGMMISYPSFLVPGIQTPDSDIKLDLYTASWLASIVGFACIPGTLASYLIMELRGRKLAHIILLIPGIIAWICIYFAKNFRILIVGRLLAGFCAFATTSLGTVIIGEYTSPRYRGVFLNLKTTGVCFGNMVMHILGHIYTWRTVALIGAVPLFISLLITCTWPESPAWLVSKNQYEESKMSFYWLRGRDEGAKNEIKDFLRAQREKLSDQPASKTLHGIISMFFKKFTMKDFIQPSIIMLFCLVLLESSGRHLFPAYAIQFIEDVTGDKTQTFYYILGIDVIITTSATLSAVLVGLMKKRTLLFFSGLAALLILFICCYYLYIESKDIFVSKGSFVPVILFTLYFILINFGCVPISLAMQGEIFPLAHEELDH